MPISLAASPATAPSTGNPSLEEIVLELASLKSLAQVHAYIQSIQHHLVAILDKQLSDFSHLTNRNIIRFFRREHDYILDAAIAQILSREILSLRRDTLKAKRPV